MATPALSGRTVLDWENRRYCARHSVEVSADPERVWADLENFAEWQNWNPLYVQSSGTLAEGNRIQFAVSLPGMKPQAGEASVIKVIPREFLQYEIKSLGGLVTAIRFVEIRQSGANCTTLTNGEIMTGVLAPLFFKCFGDRVRQGLENMNLALAARFHGPLPR